MQRYAFFMPNFKQQTFLLQIMLQQLQDNNDVNGGLNF